MPCPRVVILKPVFGLKNLSGRDETLFAAAGVFVLRLPRTVSRVAGQGKSEEPCRGD
jgi:hypothetical protein